MSDKDDGYGLSQAKKTDAITPPSVNYLPANPKNKNIGIGIIGAGGIAAYHLKAYQKIGLRVLAICDIDQEKAKALQSTTFPEASVYKDYVELLNRDDIEVVDIALHPNVRVPIVRAALEAGKHVLSQKPFVLNLDEGAELVALAEKKNLRLAVNHNGRWAPHWSYMRNAIASGWVGDIRSVNFSLQWDQTWIKDSPAFQAIRHMVLYDFAIHWFDITNCFMSNTPAERVYASARKFPGQIYRPATLAGAIIDYPDAQVTMSFNAHTTCGEQDTTTVVGSKATLRSSGVGLNEQPRMDIFTPNGKCSVDLQGNWFTNGFEGTMAELLAAIEEKREPYNSAKSSLKSLELCFAAIGSAEKSKIITPGEIRSITDFM